MVTDTATHGHGWVVEVVEVRKEGVSAWESEEASARAAQRLKMRQPTANRAERGTWRMVLPVFIGMVELTTTILH